MLSQIWLRERGHREVIDSSRHGGRPLQGEFAAQGFCINARKREEFFSLMSAQKVFCCHSAAKQRRHQIVDHSPQSEDQML
ncbi:MAG: hypothetical protein DWI00_02560 [Planctomycetota bacterium]|nr:MAG: hypothetical protein DWI00_02560 [Planctomycetota bacterium]